MQRGLGGNQDQRKGCKEDRIWDRGREQMGKREERRERRKSEVGDPKVAR